MAAYSGTKIVEDGLVLNIDAGNKLCYSNGSLDVGYILVAGGGAGGYRHGAGGGAGGVLFGQTTASGSSAITIGAGAAWATISPTGNSGNDTTAFGQTALGGGGGGTYDSSNLPAVGGSGGGRSSNISGPGLGTAGQGHDGGTTNYTGSPYNHAGGGGAGSVGGTGTSTSCGDGGDGVFINFLIKHFMNTNTGCYVGGGGGGGSHNPAPINGQSFGGKGGGGRGGIPGQKNSGDNGLSYSGGGGGGASTDSGGSNNGGNGGSGMAIVYYKGPQRAYGGDETFQAYGNTVHVFRNTSMFTVDTNCGDLSDNGNNGQLWNGVSYSTDGGGSFQFDGSNDYINCGNDISLQISDNVTLEAWIKDASFSDVGNIISKNTNSGYRFRVDTNRQLWMYSYGNSTTSSPNVINLNQWHHTVAVFSSTGLRLYLDGQLVSSNTTPYSPNTVTTGDLFIGTYSTGNEFFNGNIAIARVYNKALTADEVRQNFVANRKRFGI